MASKMFAKLLGLVSLVLYCLPSVSPHSDLLQDFCVANPTEKVYVNGYPCKDPMLAEVNDFFLSGFDKEGNTTNPLGSKVTPVAAKHIPGLNTLGLSMVRIDLAPYGVNPPHTHPRASEIITVLEGTMEVGFVTSAPQYRFFTKILNKGDVFVFPMGLVHYQRNNGSTKAVAIGALNSQNAGVVVLGSSLFNCTPEMPSDMLGRVLQVDYNIIAQLKKKP